jgi:hypothetical protein
VTAVVKAESLTECFGKVSARHERVSQTTTSRALSAADTFGADERLATQ